MQEAEVVIIFGGINLHALGQAVQHEGENLQRIAHIERIRPREFFDIGFVRP